MFFKLNPLWAGYGSHWICDPPRCCYFVYKMESQAPFLGLLFYYSYHCMDVGPVILKDHFISASHRIHKTVLTTDFQTIFAWATSHSINRWLVVSNPIVHKGQRKFSSSMIFLLTRKDFVGRIFGCTFHKKIFNLWGILSFQINSQFTMQVEELIRLVVVLTE